MTIEPQAIEFENLGTTIEVIVNGTTSFNGSDFRLKQFHIHTPSEHRISEEFYPLEAHFVHEGVTDPTAITVVGVVFDLCTSANATSPILKGLAPHIEAIREPGTTTSIEEGLDFTGLIKHVQTSDIFQYSGSLTTPPCAEGVTFLIAKTPLAIDVATFNAIKSVVKFNARYTQGTLGEANLVEVAQKAGTEEQWDVPPVGEETPAANGTLSVTAAPTPSCTEEAAGQPTSLLSVIVEGR